MRRPSPSRCPYCTADAPRRWIRRGSYERYAGDLDDSNRRISVPRYRCKLTERTFSLLPDELLPYCGLRTPVVLSSLRALYLEHRSLNELARSLALPRATVRHLKARFLRTLPLLRLPPREGALGAEAFLEAVTSEAPGRPAPSIAELLRTWKEREPKHSVVGIYAR